MTRWAVLLLVGLVAAVVQGAAHTIVCAPSTLPAGPLLAKVSKRLEFRFWLPCDISFRRRKGRIPINVHDLCGSFAAKALLCVGARHVNASRRSGKIRGAGKEECVHIRPGEPTMFFEIRISLGCRSARDHGTESPPQQCCVLGFFRQEWVDQLQEAIVHGSGGSLLDCVLCVIGVVGDSRELTACRAVARAFSSARSAEAQAFAEAAAEAFAITNECEEAVATAQVRRECAMRF